MSHRSSPSTLFNLVFVFVLLAFSPVYGESGAQATGTGGTVQGTVVDQSKAVVAGATVELTNGVTSYSKTATTDASGNFRFANVPFNNYRLSVQLSGFQPYSQDVDVRSSVPIQVGPVLQVGVAKQTVEVSADAQMVESVPDAHTDVSDKLISTLPIASPSQGLSDLITLTSGSVVADSNGFFHPAGDHGETTYVVDGQPISDQQNKTFSTQLPANAFQSMELVSSAPAAEFGDKTGLIVNAVTKSGLGQAPTGSFDSYYGSFGSFGEDASFGVGGSRWGNFFVADTSRSGRFLDSPEFAPNHDIGNSENIFDRIDFQPSANDSVHLDASGARNWFQIPNTYDQAFQDQRQEATTISLGLGYQHTFTPKLLLSVNPFFRQDHVQYFPSPDDFDDNPATISQDRHLTNWGSRIDISFANGWNNLKVGTQLMQTRLDENFAFGITDPALNSPCTGLNAGTCTAPGLSPNPQYSPGLAAYDLTRGGSLFHFTGSAHINQEAVYAQDQITIRGLTLSPGLRFDNYSGLTHDELVEPRFGIAYLFKRTNTVLRGSADRSLETPYNENLVLSSTTGAGGLASPQFGGFGATPLKPGHRTEYSGGLQQGAGKLLQISADYFWKHTENAFDFDTLFNTPITFPISWRQSKIDGVSARISTRTIQGFQAYTTFGHTRARFFGPEAGGLIFNSPLSTGAFRIDHDQEFQQTTYVRYQHGKDGWWGAVTWRFDSGEVAGSVASLNDALALDADQQAAIGFHCGSDVASISNHIDSCNGTYGATRLNIPAAGTFNPDTNPPRIASRNIVDASLGTDNLFHKEKLKTTLKLTATNLTNEAALYNFLSTFSGTHWVTPRSYQLMVGWDY